jgi:hypothetical protein
MDREEPEAKHPAVWTRAAEQMRSGLLKVVRDGVGPLSGTVPYADSRLTRYQDPEVAIRRIVRETVGATATSGFVTGLGGFVTMPVTVPAGMAGAAILNARMVAAIAHLRGWPLEDPAVQTAVLLVIAGESATSAVRTLGIKVGSKLTLRTIERIPVEVIRRINAKVGFMLLAKYGTKRSALTLAKAVPVVGGVVAGGVDAGFTRSAAAVAKKVFPAEEGGGAGTFTFVAGPPPSSSTSRARARLGAAQSTI